MLRQGQLVGVLYLENSLTGDAFSPDRVGILQVLAAQAAISLENAALYDELEQRVVDRTSELQASLHMLKENQAQLIEAERKTTAARYEREVAIARHIQTSILPKDLHLEGFQLAAAMVTATEVGGDYYDLVPVGDGGFWLGIGDVSGHGLNAGLMMLMIQSCLAGLLRRDPFADPSHQLCLLNDVLYENMRKRLEATDYATLSLLRFFPDGRFLIAGAHEDSLIWRAREKRVERVLTEGTWMGIADSVAAAMVTREHHLYPGDILMLYTDGITEAGADGPGLFGLDRLADLLERTHAQPVDAILRSVYDEVNAWSPTRTDDQALLVLRRSAP
jgi:serine phosphatase RsbU (regulator of sigma subunit)